MKKLVLICLLIAISCSNKKENNVLVFNVGDDKTRVELIEMELDKKHPNLLNPSISKKNYDSVLGSWTELHKELNDFLNKNNFEWDVNEEKIKIFNKIYFDKSGKVKVYAFRILNRNAAKKSDEYGQLMLKFLKGIKISIARDFDFAQCGKISLPNKNLKS